MSSGPRRVKGLDGVRGFAILWVLLFHLYATLPKANWASVTGLGWFSSLGWIGVSLFFTLSGYLIIPMVADQKADPGFFARFWCRRAFRLLPVYGLLLLTFLAAAACWPEAAPGRDELLNTRLPLWSYGVFAQNILMSAHDYMGNEWLRVSWSLAVEVQFYGLICLVVILLPRARLGSGLWVLLAGVVLLRYAAVFLNPGATLSLVLLVPCRMDAFLAGGLAALLPLPVAGGELRRQGIALAVLLLSSGAFFWSALEWRGSWVPYALPTYYFMLSIGSAALLELCAGSSPVVKWLMESPPLIRAGKLSYFLYLFHLPVLWTVYTLGFGLAPNLSSGRALLMLAVVLAVLYGLAELSYRFLEAPLIRRSHGYFLRGPGKVA